MSTKLHRLAAGAIVAVIACALIVPVASGTLASGTLAAGSYRLAGGAPHVRQPIGLPTKVHMKFSWYRWHPSTRSLEVRSLEARDRAFGNRAVIGLSLIHI